MKTLDYILAVACCAILAYFMYVPFAEKSAASSPGDRMAPFIWHAPESDVIPYVSYGPIQEWRAKGVRCFAPPTRTKMTGWSCIAVGDGTGLPLPVFP